MIVFVGFMITMALFYILGYEVLGRIVSYSIFGLLLVAFIRLRGIKRYEITGTLVLADEIISVNEKDYPIDVIEDIEVIYKAYEGQTSSVTMFGIYKGDNNQIIVNLKSQDIIRRTFLSTSKYDCRKLTELVAIYREKGVSTNLVKKRHYQ